MAGAVGAIAGGLISNFAGSLISNLVSSFGSNMMGGALGNMLSGAVGNAVNSVIQQLPLPSFIKDLATGIVDSAVQDSKDESVSSDCQCAAESTFGEAVEGVEKKVADLLMEGVQKNFEEEGKKEAKGKGGAENWLVALAKTMADIQNEHLGKMLDASEKMAENVGDGEKKQEAFIDAQAEFQARSKLFGMASEATSTALKTIGEGLSSLARKQ